MAVDAEAYPAARLERDGPPSSGVSSALVPSPPRARSFWFELRTNASSRTTISTPALHGPVIVSGLQWGAGGGSPPDAAGWFLDIGVNPTAVSEVNVAVTLGRTWRSLFEDMVPRTVNVPNGLMGLPSHSGWGAVSDNWWPINQLVLDSEFFLVLSLLNLVAAQRVSHGTLYLVEGVTAEAVRSFH